MYYRILFSIKKRIVGTLFEITTRFTLASSNLIASFHLKTAPDSSQCSSWKRLTERDVKKGPKIVWKMTAAADKHRDW